MDEDRFDFRTRVNDAALRAVRAAGNRRGEAVVLAEFGQLRYDQDRYPEAVELLREALAGFITVGDTRAEALTMADLGAAHRELGEFQESLRMLDAAAERLHHIGDDTATGNALRLAGSVRVEIGQFTGARRDLDASLAAYQRAGSRRGLGMTLRSLGLYFRATGEFAEAVEVCARSADENGAYAHVRSGLADKLLSAQSTLPTGYRFLVIEAFRPMSLQIAYFEAHVAKLRLAFPALATSALEQMASRYISSPPVAPHVAGAAVDLTLCAEEGTELWLGTEVNNTDTNSCHTAATDISPLAAALRRILGHALAAAGPVNYPSEGWHWSYGDRYWAHLTGAAHARYALWTTLHTTGTIHRSQSMLG